MAKGRVSKSTASRKGKGRQTDASSSRLAANAAAQLVDQERSNEDAHTEQEDQQETNAGPSSTSEQNLHALISQQLETIIANQASTTARLNELEAARQTDRDNVNTTLDSIRTEIEGCKTGLELAQAAEIRQSMRLMEMDQFQRALGPRIAQTKRDVDWLRSNVARIVNEAKTSIVSQLEQDLQTRTGQQLFRVMARLNDIERVRTTDRDAFDRAHRDVSRELGNINNSIETFEARQGVRLHEMEEKQRFTESWVKTVHRNLGRVFHAVRDD